MKSICMFNNKGGVGKTTLLCNLAAYLSIYENKRILVIDADPQCNSSSYLLDETKIENILNEGKDSLNSFYGPIKEGNRGDIKKPKVYKSERFKIDLLVGSPKLSLTEDFLANDWLATTNGDKRGFGTTFSISELFEMNKDDYDYIFIDMGPSLGALNRSILLNSDYFIMPLSVDIFSTMAISNIVTSFRFWKNSLEGALRAYSAKNAEEYKLKNGDAVSWKLNFLGYVRQLYKAKSVKGERQHVKSYEEIIKHQELEIRELRKFFNFNDSSDLKLGEIQTLNSLIPLSQQAHAPIFELGSKDGIVGAHYSSVSAAKEYFAEIAKNLLKKLAEV